MSGVEFSVVERAARAGATAQARANSARSVRARRDATCSARASPARSAQRSPDRGGWSFVDGYLRLRFVDGAARYDAEDPRLVDFFARGFERVGDVDVSSRGVETRLQVIEDAQFAGVLSDQVERVHAARLADPIDASDPLLETHRIPRQLEVDHHTTGMVKIQSFAAGVGRRTVS